jgi:ribokinase
MSVAMLYSAIHNEPVPSHALGYAQQSGWQTSIDLCEPLTRHFDQIISQLAHPISVLLGNQAEMQAVAAFRASAAPICITKQGAAGALISRNGQTTHYPAFAVDAIDTTACGDTFASGVYSPSATALPLPMPYSPDAAGAITAGRRGAADIVPTHTEVRALLTQHQQPIPRWLLTMVQ